MKRNHRTYLSWLLRVAALTVVVSAWAAVPVFAVPTSVNLRVEGSAGTIYEGDVTSDAKSLMPHEGYKGDFPVPCVGEADNPGATPMTVFDDASSGGAFSWRSDPNYLFPEKINSDLADFAANKNWIVYVNNAGLAVGPCVKTLKPGDKVLFGFGGFGGAPDYPPPPVLGLDPSIAKTQAGQPVTVVASSYDAKGVGSPAAGATVVGGGQSAATGSDGKATLTFSSPGTVTLKAQKSGQIRSNSASVCVYIPGSGACDTVKDQPKSVEVDSVAAKGRILLSKNRYRRLGPKLLKGLVPADPSGIAAVKLRLTRVAGKHACRAYNFKSERFTSVCKSAKFKKIGSAPANTDLPWSYQLRTPLLPGRYQLELKVVDGAGNVDATEYLRNRRIFRVTH